MSPAAAAQVTGERDAALKEKAAAVAKAAQAVVEGRRRDKERERLEDRVRASRRHCARAHPLY